jgi:hypothetical protein
VPSELDQQQHHCCHAIALQVLETFRSLLREEEHRDAYAEAYAIARQEIQTYEGLRRLSHDNSVSALQKQAEGEARVAWQENTLPLLPVGHAAGPNEDMVRPDDLPERKLGYGGY